MKHFRRVVPGVLLLLLTLGTTTSCLWQKWARADEFAAGLRCGMTREEVKRYASQFSGVVVNDHPGGTNLPQIVVIHEDTYVNMWFENEALRRVQVTWVSAPMKLRQEPAHELCAANR